MVCGSLRPNGGVGAQPPQKYGRLYLKIPRADKLKYTSNFISAHLLWICLNIVLYIFSGLRPSTRGGGTVSRTSDV
jgi:hypothetical protein